MTLHQRKAKVKARARIKKREALELVMCYYLDHIEDHLSILPGVEKLRTRLQMRKLHIEYLQEAREEAAKTA